MQGGGADGKTERRPQKDRGDEDAGADQRDSKEKRRDSGEKSDEIIEIAGRRDRFREGKEPRNQKPEGDAGSDEGDVQGGG